MKLKTRNPLFLITFGVVLFAVSMNLKLVLQFLQNLLGLFFPILLGLLIAFVLNVPMSGFERLITRIFRKSGRKLSTKLLHGISLVLTLVCILFIYPHVVGGSVGLAPLWTLMAALIGGKMFGLPGIIFFIPLTAVLYTILRDNTNRKLREKETAIGKEDDTVNVC